MDEVVHAAVDAGVNYVDLLYNGRFFWDAFAAAIRSCRDQVVVAAHWGRAKPTANHPAYRTRRPACASSRRRWPA